MKIYMKILNNNLDAMHCLKKFRSAYFSKMNRHNDFTYIFNTNGSNFFSIRNSTQDYMNLHYDLERKQISASITAYNKKLQCITISLNSEVSIGYIKKILITDEHLKYTNEDELFLAVSVLADTHGITKRNLYNKVQDIKKIISLID